MNHEIGIWTLCCCCCLTFSTIIGGLIPLLFKCCKDKVHYCPTCKLYAGRTRYDPCCCEPDVPEEVYMKSNEPQGSNENDRTIVRRRRTRFSFFL